MDGRLKVLDFGLAKAIEGAGVHGPAEAGHDAPRAAGRDALSQSPTLTTPTMAGMMTGVGTILGTSAYMSPEQPPSSDPR